MQCGLDGAVEMWACLWSETDEALYELALTIENESLRNPIVVAEQKGYQVFIGFCERVLDAEVLCEGGDLLFITWSTDVEPDNIEALVRILRLQSD